MEGETTLNRTQGKNGTCKRAVFPKVLQKFMYPFKGWSDVQVHDLTVKNEPECMSASSSNASCQKNLNRIGGGDDLKSHTGRKWHFHKSCLSKSPGEIHVPIQGLVRRSSPLSHIKDMPECMSASLNAGSRKNSNRIGGGDDLKSYTAVERKFLRKRT